MFGEERALSENGSKHGHGSQAKSNGKFGLQMGTRQILNFNILAVAYWRNDIRRNGSEECLIFEGQLDLRLLLLLAWSLPPEKDERSRSRRRSTTRAAVETKSMLVQFGQADPKMEIGSRTATGMHFRVSRKNVKESKKCPTGQLLNCSQMRPIFGTRIGNHQIMAVTSTRMLLLSFCLPLPCSVN